MYRNLKMFIFGKTQNKTCRLILCMFVCVIRSATDVDSLFYPSGSPASVPGLWLPCCPGLPCSACPRRRIQCPARRCCRGIHCSACCRRRGIPCSACRIRLQYVEAWSPPTPPLSPLLHLPPHTLRPEPHPTMLQRVSTDGTERPLKLTRAFTQIHRNCNRNSSISALSTHTHTHTSGWHQGCWTPPLLSSPLLSSQPGHYNCIIDLHRMKSPLSS